MGVQCADGHVWNLPLDDLSDVAELKAHVATEMGNEDGMLIFEMEDGSALPAKRFVPGSRIVCGETAESLDIARKLLQDVGPGESMRLVEELEVPALRVASDAKLLLEVLDTVADDLQS